MAYHVLPSLLLNEYQKQQMKLADVTARAKQDHSALVDVTAREAHSSQELAQLRDELAARDKELAAMRVEMKSLRQVTRQLVAERSSDSHVAQVNP